MRPSSAAFCLALVACSACADQRFLLDSYLPSDLTPSATTPPGTQGYWAIGTSDGMATLVRYNASGSIVLMRYPDMQNMQVGQDFRLYSMPDGGLLTTDIEDGRQAGNPTCQLRRFDAAGDYLWTSALAALVFSDTGATVCSGVFVDGTGGIWLYPAGIYGYELVEVNPEDGSSGQQRSVSTENGVAADTSSHAVFLAGSTVSGSTTLGAVRKVTPQGVAWISNAPSGDTGSTLSSMAVATDGSLWAFGQRNGQLFGMHLAGDGKRLWSGAFDTSVNPKDIALAPRADGGVSELHWDTSALNNHAANSAPELNTFDSAGGRLWSASTGFALPDQAYVVQLNLAVAPNEDVVATLLSHGDGADPQDYLLQTRLGAGIALYARPAQARPEVGALSLNFFPDGSSFTAAGAFERLSRNGAALSAPQTTSITTATSLDGNAVFAADGTSYLLVANADRKEFGVTALASDGSVRWHTPVSSSWDKQGFSVPLLLLRNNDVCAAGYIGGDEAVQCFALDTGAASPKLVLASSLTIYGTYSQAIVTGADQIVLLYKAADGLMHHALIDSANAVQHDVTPLQAGESWYVAGQNATGQTLIVASPGFLVKVAADGSRLYSVALDTFLWTVSAVALMSDGSAILAGPPQIERVDDAGTPVWRSTIPSLPSATAQSLRITADDLYMVVAPSNFSYGYPWPQNGFVLKLALADGSIVWSTPLRYANYLHLALDPDSASVLAFSSWYDTTQIWRLAMADGAQLGGEFEPCDVDQCVLYRAIVANDGSVRMVHDTTDFFSGSAFEMTILQNVRDTLFANGFQL